MVCVLVYVYVGSTWSSKVMGHRCAVVHPPALSHHMFTWYPEFTPSELVVFGITIF